MGVSKLDGKGLKAVGKGAMVHAAANLGRQHHLAESQRDQRLRSQRLAGLHGNSTRKAGTKTGHIQSGFRVARAECAPGKNLLGISQTVMALQRRRAPSRGAASLLDPP